MLCLGPGFDSIDYSIECETEILLSLDETSTASFAEKTFPFLLGSFDFSFLFCKNSNSPGYAGLLLGSAFLHSFVSL